MADVRKVLWVGFDNRLTLEESVGTFSRFRTVAEADVPSLITENVRAGCAVDMREAHAKEVDLIETYGLRVA